MDTLAIAAALLFVFLVLALLFFAAVKIVDQYERILIFTLGRTSPEEVKGPGWVFVVPIVQRGIRVDLREKFIEVPSQTSITKDNAPISIDFLVYSKVFDPEQSVEGVHGERGHQQFVAQAAPAVSRVQTEGTPVQRQAPMARKWFAEPRPAHVPVSDPPPLSEDH